MPKRPKANGITKSKAPPVPKKATKKRRPKAGDKEYSKNYAFVHCRTVFRTMLQYIKFAYKPYFDKSKGNRKNPEGMTVEESVKRFCQDQLPGTLECLSTAAEKKEFLELLKMIALANQYSRNVDYLQNLPLGWEVVRGPCYL